MVLNINESAINFLFDNLSNSLGSESPAADELSKGIRSQVGRGSPHSIFQHSHTEEFNESDFYFFINIDSQYNSFLIPY